MSKVSRAQGKHLHTVKPEAPQGDKVNKHVTDASENLQWKETKSEAKDSWNR